MAVETQQASPIPPIYPIRHNEPRGSNVAIRLSIAATVEELRALENALLKPSSVSGLTHGTWSANNSDAASRDAFRATLLAELRHGWKNVATETHFLTLVANLQREGCTILAGLIDNLSFRQLIDDYTKIMDQGGSQAFLHSFAHLDKHPEFMGNPALNGAIIHPLLIGMVAYAMGGPVRMTDARGKDTQPISVNAQDNMLHVDNTPFRQEYKMLIA